MWHKPPGSDVDFPSGQSVHDADDGDTVDFPIGHDVQLGLFACENLPTIMDLAIMSNKDIIVNYILPIGQSKQSIES